MMTRRTFMIAPAAVGVSGGGPGAGVPASGRIAFRVMRKGSQIGTHSIEFRRAGDVLDATIDIRLAVTFGPFTLFRYRMMGVETWRDDRFAELTTTTDNDGEALRVTAKRGPGGIVVESNKYGRQTLSADALPLNHWNIANMTAPLFNPQSGRLMQLTGKALGTTRVALASGAEVPATHFSLTGEATLDDWYDANNVWTALRSVAKDGSIIDYQRLS
jgi:hypothetical protein